MEEVDVKNGNFEVKTLGKGIAKSTLTFSSRSIQCSVEGIKKGRNVDDEGLLENCFQPAPLFLFALLPIDNVLCRKLGSTVNEEGISGFSEFRDLSGAVLMSTGRSAPTKIASK